MSIDKSALSNVRADVKSGHRKLRVGITRRLPKRVEERMHTLFEVIDNPHQNEFDDKPLSREALVDIANNVDVLTPTLGDRLDKDFFSQLNGRLKLIANFGAGTDHIDIGLANERGIVVTNTPSVLAQDAADMAMALILAVPRRLVEGVQVLRQGKFAGWSPTWMLGHRVRGKKLGIIGLGRVGQAIARRAKAFGLEVNYHNRKPINAHMEADLGATYWASLDQMLNRVDIVSVNCPHTPATYHLLSRRRLQLLQPHAYIVNISRSEIIDETALAEMIANGQIAGAGLDVFQGDPMANETLFNAPNVVLLPHMASATQESRLEMGERMIINIKMWVDGHHPPDRVIPGIH